jgi:hypothetical protein
MNTPNTFKDPTCTCDICERGMMPDPEKDLNFNVCKICRLNIDKELANTTVLGHLWDCLKCIFDFSPISAIGALIFAVSRAFKIGSYHPVTGDFYVRGLIKKPPIKDE